MKKYFVFWGVVLLSLICGLNSCNRVSAPDVSNIDLSFNSHLFFMDVFEGAKEDIDVRVEVLNEKYNGYLEAYSQRMIKIGSVDDPDYPQYLKAFIEYEANQDVFAKCKEEYAQIDPILDELKQAFKYYKYYFPESMIPDVYFHISGFNQSIAVDSAWVSVSVEKYLGEDCEFYEWLTIPAYLRKRMVKQKIVPDVMKAIAMTSFPSEMKNEDVLSSMIQKGKILYFISRTNPYLSQKYLFDLSEQELQWCIKNEATIWATMVERKHVYNNDRMVIQKYTGDSPFTYYFGQDSPGRAAVFLGYRIIEAFMSNHEDLSLSDLMNEKDGHLIFRESRYRP